MYQDIYLRTKEFATFIIENKATIRQCAKFYNVSKSTVHAYLKFKLPFIDKSLYEQVRAILQTNFEEKHIRGGFATKQKYSQEKLIEYHSTELNY